VPGSTKTWVTALISAWAPWAGTTVSGWSDCTWVSTSIQLAVSESPQ